MSEIVNCEYSKTIMKEPVCNAFDVNRYGEIICSEENCIILKLKEQLQAKEQECEALKGENFTFVDLIKTQEELIDKYEQSLDEIEEIANKQRKFDLTGKAPLIPVINEVGEDFIDILDIINKAKEKQ